MERKAYSLGNQIKRDNNTEYVKREIRSVKN